MRRCVEENVAMSAADMDMKVPAEGVPRLRQCLYHQLGREFAEACILHATRDPEVVRDSLGGLLDRVNDLRDLLSDDVGWKDRDDERNVRVRHTSEAFRRATETRSLNSEMIDCKVNDGVVTVTWRPGGDA
jgi:hypothetical protein